MKVYFQLVLVLALSAAMALGAQLNGNLITYKHSGEMRPSAQEEREYATSQNLADLLKHNFAVFKGTQESSSAEFINKFGKGTVLKPVQMNYLFLFEGLSDTAESEQQQSELFPNSEPFVLQLPDGQSSIASVAQPKLLDDLYDLYEQNSLASLVEESYNTDERIPFYYFSAAAPRQASLARLHAQYGLSFVNTNDEKIQLFDERENKQFGNAFSIEQCLQTHFKDIFGYSATHNSFYKVNTNLKLQVQERNIHKVSQILKEVCGTLKMSTVFRKSTKPNQITFHLLSFSDANGVLSSTELAFVRDLWRITVAKVISNFANNFEQSELFGETLFVAPGQVEIDLLREDFAHTEIGRITENNISERARILASTRTHTRVLQLAPGPTPDSTSNSSQQIKFWICIILPVIFYFILYQLVTMRTHKDSLLYAKFLTSDARN